MLHKIHDPDRGAGLTEYAAVIVLVAAILAGLVAAGVPGRVASGVDTALITLLDPESGDPASTGEDGTVVSTAGGDGKTMRADPGATAEIQPDSAAEEPKDDGFNEEWWDDSGTWGSPSDKMPLFGFQDRGDYNWDCGQVLDGFCKIGGGLYSGARDITDPLADIACLAHICSHSGFKNNWKETTDGVKKVFTQSPITTGKELWEGFKQPFDDAAKKGGGFKNTAYAIPSAIGSVLSFKGVTKAFKEKKEEKEEKPEDKEEPKKESNGHEPGHGMGDARIPPDDHVDALKWGKDNYPIPDNLTKAEQDSIFYYAGGSGPGGTYGNGFQHVNRILRGEEPLESRTDRDKVESEEAIKNIDAAMKKNRIREPIVTYRSTSPNYFEKMGIDPTDPSAVEGLIGSTLKEKGYMSTSYSKSMGTGAEKNGVDMRVRVPEGAGAMNIADHKLSPHAYESEILVDRNSQYIVHDAYIGKDGRVKMDVEIVPEGWSKPSGWEPGPLEK